MRTVPALALGALLVAATPALPQEKKESADPVVYRVEFVIREGSDGGSKAGRRYAMLVDTGGRGTFRVGNRVPYATGSFQPGQSAGGATPLVATNYQYFDTGVNIDCRIRELSGGKVSLNADIDVSTVVQHDRGHATTPPNPTIASVRIGVSSVLTPGKPALVASIDDPATARQFDVEATVTKVN